MKGKFGINIFYSHFVTLLTIASVLSCSAILSTEHAASVDEFAIAIQHFDPNHNLGFDFDGEEVRFLQQATNMERGIFKSTF